MTMIRNMQAGDYDAVLSLWLASPEMELNDVDDSREGIERFLRRNADTCFVAEEDGRILGVILASDDGRRGYVYHACVAPDCRGRGLGKQLIERVISAFQDHGLSKAGLLVFCSNENGIAFWEHFGFITRRDLYYESLPLRELHRIESSSALPSPQH